MISDRDFIPEKVTSRPFLLFLVLIVLRFIILILTVPA